MGTYLQDNPPRIQQYRCPRRRAPSGILGVHTAESIADEIGPDTGAENVARFIRDRTNYGSYHWLADSDSIIQLIPHSCVAYHIGTHSLNEHTIGISAACQAAKWDSLDDDYVDAMVRNMARCAADAARWLKREHNITVPAKRLTLSQALDGQRGFLAHGDADPDRRTDPGKTFPWSQFLSNYSDEMEDDMTPEQAKQLAMVHKVLTNGGTSLVGYPTQDKQGSIRYAIQRAWYWCYAAAGLPIPPNSWMAKRWPDVPKGGYQPRTYIRAGYGWARRGAEVSEANGVQLANLAGEQAAMRNAVQQLADESGVPVDMAAVQAAALAGAQTAMAELDIRVEISPAEEPTDTPVEPADDDQD